MGSTTNTGGGGTGVGAALLTLTAGGILVFSAFKGLSLAEVLSGATGAPLNAAGPSRADIQAKFNQMFNPASTDPASTPSNPLDTSTLPGGFPSTTSEYQNVKGSQVWRNVRHNPQMKRVPSWMIPFLDASVKAGWSGIISSGVRTPASSIAACYGICGAPSCSGTCAGATSNHNFTEDQGYPNGAIDVTDFGNFGAIQHKIGSPLKNDLPADLVHFSVTGH